MVASMGVEHKVKRCAWVTTDPLYIEYHDKEWGVPVFDDQKLFEFLILEGAQAGLSWFTILKRRENYRKSFDHFDMKKIALYSEKKIQALLKDEGIIRNQLKIRGTVKNAQAAIAVAEEFGSLSNYLWKFVQGKPIINHWKSSGEVPSFTPVSDQFSKDLKKRGFTFVGSTICYAFMQAVGMVNDHTKDCFFR
jgi:DNA-3-methyladenine glycosylase I